MLEKEEMGMWGPGPRLLTLQRPHCQTFLSSNQAGGKGQSVSQPGSWTELTAAPLPHALGKLCCPGSKEFPLLSAHIFRARPLLCQMTTFAPTS